VPVNCEASFENLLKQLTFLQGLLPLHLCRPFRFAGQADFLLSNSTREIPNQASVGSIETIRYAKYCRKGRDESLVLIRQRGEMLVFLTGKCPSMIAGNQPNDTSLGETEP
jgi:hypothetical protein